MKIAIGSDHGGFKIKQLIYQHLRSKKVTIIDYGCHNEESVDYPDLKFVIQLNRKMLI